MQGFKGFFSEMAKFTIMVIVIVGAVTVGTPVVLRYVESGIYARGESAVQQEALKADTAAANRDQASCLNGSHSSAKAGIAISRLSKPVAPKPDQDEPLLLATDIKNALK